MDGSNKFNHVADKKDCCTYFTGCCWAVFLIGLPLISVILIGIVLTGSSPTAFNSTAEYGDILFIITYLATFIGLVKVVVSSEDDHSQQHDNHSPISITFIFLLGLGDSLFNLTRFGDQLIWIINKNYPSHLNCKLFITVSMVENLLKCLCQLCILMFIMYQLRYPSKSKSPLPKIIKGCLSISCILQWFLLIIQEVHEKHRAHDLCILNSSVSVHSFEGIEPFLYPLGLEFRFASFIELFIISGCWEDIKNNFQRVYYWSREMMTICKCNHFQPMTTLSRFFEALFPTIHRSPIEKDRKSIAHQEATSLPQKCVRLIASIFLPAFGLLLITVSLEVVLFQEFNIGGNDHEVTKTTNDNRNLVTLISEVCEIFLAIIISILSLYTSIVLYKAKKPGQTSQSPEESIQQLEIPSANIEIRPKTVEKLNVKFKIDLFFLFIAFFFLLTYCVLTLIGSAKYQASDELTKYIKGFTLTASIIPIIQTTIQLFVIRKIPEHDHGFTENINMWIILSFAIWLFDTFSAKGYDTNKIQVDYYHERWGTLSHIFVPMAIFFRFHSCVIFANIKAGAYWDEHTISVA